MKPMNTMKAFMLASVLAIPAFYAGNANAALPSCGACVWGVPMPSTHQLYGVDSTFDCYMCHEVAAPAPAPVVTTDPAPVPAPDPVLVTTTDPAPVPAPAPDPILVTTADPAPAPAPDPVLVAITDPAPTTDDVDEDHHGNKYGRSGEHRQYKYGKSSEHRQGKYGKSGEHRQDNKHDK